jgi:hypothetical protein
MQQSWFAFWQQAQWIWRKGRAAADENLRRSAVDGEIMRKTPIEDHKLNFRDQYDDLQKLVRVTVARESGPEKAI